MEFAPKYRDTLFGPVSVLPSNKSGEQWLFVGLFSRSVSFSLERRVLGEVSFELGTPKTTRNDMLTKTGWWLSPTPLKNVKVSWDDSSQLWNNKIHVPSHQPTNMLYTKKSKKTPVSPNFEKHSSFGRWDPGSIKNHQNNGSIAGRVIARVIGSPKMDGFGVPQMKNPPDRHPFWVQMESPPLGWSQQRGFECSPPRWGSSSPSYPLEIAMAHRNSWFTH